MKRRIRIFYCEKHGYRSYVEGRPDNGAFFTTAGEAWLCTTCNGVVDELLDGKARRP